MKALKLILIIIGIVVAVALIGALFLPNSYEVKRRTIIKKPAHMIFEKISNFKNWDQWSPWNQSDKDAKYTYEGKEGTIGSKMLWLGDTVGTGSLTHTKLNEFKRIESDLELIKPWKMKTKEFVTFDEGHGNTLVTWYSVGKLSYPLGRLMNLFYNADKMMGPDYEKALKNLKNLIEGPVAINTENSPEKKIYYISIVSTTDPSDIQNKIGAAYGEIQKFVEANKIQCTAPPMVITTNYDTQSYSFDAAFEVSDNSVKPNGRVKSGAIPASKVIKAMHIGSYNQMEKTYKDIDAYIAKNKLEKNGRPFEIYLDDPQSTKISKLRTEIVYPIK